MSKKQLNNLKDICETQCSKGNYDANEYMRGLANGLLIANSIFTGKEPSFK